MLRHARPWDVFRSRNVYVPLCVVGDDSKCSQYKCWYHITTLLANVPLDETIHILAFKDNWFNKTYNMRLWYGTSPTPLLCWHVLMKPTPPFQFTMEVATKDRLPLIGTEIIIIDGRLETHVYRKKTNKGLLLHYQSHVDSRYKRLLLTTMLDPAKRLSSTQDFLFARSEIGRRGSQTTWRSGNKN